MNLKQIVVATTASFALTLPAWAQSSGSTGSDASSAGMSSAMQSHDEQTVRQVQQALKDKGHDLQVDGIMGPQTQAALRDFQQQQGMQGSGNLNQQTLSALGVQAGSGMGASPAGGGATGGSNMDSRSGSSGSGGGSRSNMDSPSGAAGGGPTGTGKPGSAGQAAQ